MNKADTKPDYKRMYEIARSLFDKTHHFRHGPFDETYYTLRVYESAKEIIKKLNEKCNKEEILTAAILHDTGKTKINTKKLFGKKGFLKNANKEWHRHENLSVPIARKILKRLGHSDEFIKEVCYLIENHSMRGEKIKQKSIELQILQDADLISDCGFAGFIRPFLYCGKFSHQSVLDSIRFIRDEENRVEMSGMINLEISKRIAEERMKLQNKLVNMISKDLDSDLI